MSYEQSPPSYYGQAPQQSYNQYQGQPSYSQGPQPGWAPQQQSSQWQPQGYPQQGPPPAQYNQYQQQQQQPYQGQPQFSPDQKYSQAPPSQYPSDQKYGSGPGAPPPQQSFQQQHQRPVFQWTSPSASALNTSVRDPQGREAFTIATPKKKETVVSSASGQVIAKLEWSSTPTISLKGGKVMKIKDWIPFDKQTDCRSLRHQGDQYRLAEQNGSILIFKNNEPQNVGVLSDPNDTIHLELSPEILPLLEEFIVIATILQSGHDIEKSGWFNAQSFHMGMIGGLGGAVAASS